MVNIFPREGLFFRVCYSPGIHHCIVQFEVVYDFCCFFCNRFRGWGLCQGGYLYGVKISYYNVMFIILKVLICKHFFEKGFCYIVSLGWGIYTYNIEDLVVDVYLNFGGFAFY